MTTKTTTAPAPLDTNLAINLLWVVAKSGSTKLTGAEATREAVAQLHRLGDPRGIYFTSMSSRPQDGPKVITLDLKPFARGQLVGTVDCQYCEGKHDAEFAYYSDYDDHPVFGAICDGLTAYYVREGVNFK